ncbi:hypothetical protein [Streptomyces xanthophaeus]|uniref:hypothetical protein n=1 Tax=Streptomyces xanthophaeus TaxID=67385 RepID=UPI0026498A1C|nr:hypothetical protein [Streptomyces xanthophaeus]WKD31122.1 hypothetical protein KO717_03495 [Streptomyces xanthophaeus]
MSDDKAAAAERCWPEADPLILAGRMLPALKKIMETFHVNIRDGLDLMNERYDKLAREQPENIEPDFWEYYRGPGPA